MQNDRPLAGGEDNREPFWQTYRWPHYYDYALYGYPAGFDVDFYL
jgi:hypothetical protein